ncbi:MAG: hypothetical protein M1142_02700 [Patescibacteria group bacterium]|nr:hypothetical protein [Patescibacteria group bacterium]
MKNKNYLARFANASSIASFMLGIVIGKLGWSSNAIKADLQNKNPECFP